MNVQQTPTARTESREQLSYVRLQGRWLVLARIGWGVLVVLTLVIFFASLPLYLTQLQTPCAGAACQFQQLTPGQVETLKGMNRSPGDYAAFTIALALASVTACLATSALIVWRRSDDRMALIVALLLVTLGPIIETGNVAPGPSPWVVPNQCLSFLEQVLFVLVFLLFPTGQFVPRWTRWTLVVFVGAAALPTFFPAAPFLSDTAVSTAVSQPGWLVSLGEMATIALIQFYRYWRVSGPMQRQQTKWVVLGLAVPITVYVLVTVLSLIFPRLASSDSLSALAFNEAGFILPLCFPLALGFAILRYRLWEIDRLINKVLVYALLTGLLGALYSGLILGLEHLVGLITGQEEQPVVLVVSTLAIAALFLPVRRRLQALIDRRFYRKKYDAEKTLAAFSATLRNQVDLEQIREQVLSVVSETMQPASLSLWICPPKPQAAEGGTRAAAPTLAEERAGAERSDAR